MKSKQKPKTNPNGANQYQLDPRQKLCWDYYIDPTSETFSNAYQSAVKAGYDETTALGITVTKWFTEKTRTLNMLDKAEQVLNDMLEMTTGTEVIVDGIAIKKTEPTLVKIKQDTAKFIAERVGKEKYSSRSELTGKGGKDLPTPILGTLNVSNNNSNEEDSQDDETHQGSTRGDISEQDDINRAGVNSSSTDGQNTNIDEHSVGVSTSPKAWSTKGLQEHTQEPPILERI